MHQVRAYLGAFEHRGTEHSPLAVRQPIYEKSAPNTRLPILSAVRLVHTINVGEKEIIMITFTVYLLCVKARFLMVYTYLIFPTTREMCASITLLLSMRKMWLKEIKALAQCHNF